MKLAVKVRINGETEVMDISGDCLKALQSAVGGYVEAVDIGKGLTLWCDEEGKLKSYPTNEVASMLCKFDRIVGDVVITAGFDDEGDIEPLSDKKVDSVVNFVQVARRKIN